MSNEENTNQTVESAAPAEATVAPAAPANSAVSNLIATAMALKESNPKVFFGVIGGGVALLLLIMMSGGGSEPIAGPVMKNLVVGQQYVLKSANAYDEKATVRLVSVPGAIAAYDDTEEADRNGACQHMPQGTAVSVVELQDAYGKKNSYAKVRMEEGDCKGNEGWALSIDVQ